MLCLQAGVDFKINTSTGQTHTARLAHMSATRNAGVHIHCVVDKCIDTNKS
jgi:hypothetical protein